ncbi:hypothetical protein Q0F98_29500 [Paenibacillus amylolyticus]|nr:hypothetical protein Q0F98_29500 [Paenibacillus amylolyticus]
MVIPANPQRVASDQYMGYLLKLGIVPVGVRTFMLNEGWIEKSGIAADVIAGIEDLGGEFPMNLEKLVSLEPDLIIGSIDKNIEDYEKIATTVFYLIGKAIKLLAHWKSCAGLLVFLEKRRKQSNGSRHMKRISKRLRSR